MKAGRVEEGLPGCPDKPEELLRVFPAPVAPFAEELRVSYPAMGLRKVFLFSFFLP